MKLLLDTCTFLWIASDAPELSRACRTLFADPSNEVYLSAVSALEIAIKHALGQLPLPAPPPVFVSQERSRHEIEPLPLVEEAALRMGQLPAVHRDPFDRALVCQAITHGMTLLTPDPNIGKYPVSVVW